MPNATDLSLTVQTVPVVLKMKSQEGMVAVHQFTGKAAINALDPEITYKVEPLKSGNSRVRITVRVPDYTKLTVADATAFDQIEITRIVNPNLPSTQRAWAMDFVLALLANTTVRQVVDDGFAWY